MELGVREHLFSHSGKGRPSSQPSMEIEGQKKGEPSASLKSCTEEGGGRDLSASSSFLSFLLILDAWENKLRPASLCVCVCPDATSAFLLSKEEEEEEEEEEEGGQGRGTSVNKPHARGKGGRKKLLDMQSLSLSLCLYQTLPKAKKHSLT